MQCWARENYTGCWGLLGSQVELLMDVVDESLVIADKWA